MKPRILRTLCQCWWQACQCQGPKSPIPAHSGVEGGVSPMLSCSSCQAARRRCAAVAEQRQGLKLAGRGLTVIPCDILTQYEERYDMRFSLPEGGGWMAMGAREAASPQRLQSSRHATPCEGAVASRNRLPGDDA